MKNLVLDEDALVSDYLEDLSIRPELMKIVVEMLNALTPLNMDEKFSALNEAMGAKGFSELPITARNRRVVQEQGKALHAFENADKEPLNHMEQEVVKWVSDAYDTHVDGGGEVFRVYDTFWFNVVGRYMAERHWEFRKVHGAVEDKATYMAGYIEGMWAVRSSFKEGEHGYERDE